MKIFFARLKSNDDCKRTQNWADPPKTVSTLSSILGLIDAFPFIMFERAGRVIPNNSEALPMVNSLPSIISIFNISPGCDSSIFLSILFKFNVYPDNPNQRASINNLLNLFRGYYWYGKLEKSFSGFVTNQHQTQKAHNPMLIV